MTIATATPLRRLGLFVLGAAVFGLAYGQAPLYFSNQNQYFVHGLARAGHGTLAEDWLANTADPAPLFSGLVAVTHRWLGTWPFYVYYALLMGVYLASLVGLFDIVAGARANSTTRLVFVAVILLIHSAVLRSLSARLLGVDYPWYLQAGLAGQYVLGPIFQPSTFGVLLLLSLWLFACGRALSAAACSSLAAVCHATYVLPAALMTIAYLMVLLGQRRVMTAMLVGGIALVVVAPVLIYQAFTFAPSSAETFARAQEILVHFRLPHHCSPRQWFDWIAAAQVAWMVLGILLAWRTPLFLVLLIPLVLGVILTVVQIATASDMLALLFPWRISVILMPAATIVLVARLVRVVEPVPLARIGSLTIISLLVGGGVAIMALRLAYQERDEELPMMEHVRDHHAPGDQYLIPVAIPDLNRVRGSAKSDFKPLPTLEHNAQFIPLDLQRFRLVAGAPIFVDFKSIPYRDTDVLEWHARLYENQAFYQKLQAGKLDELLPELRHRGITHIVLPAQEKATGSRLPLVYEDRYYLIYAVEGL